MLALITLALAYAGSVALAKMVLTPYVVHYSQEYESHRIYMFSAIGWLTYKWQEFRCSRAIWSSEKEFARLKMQIWIIAIAWPVTVTIELVGLIVVWPIRFACMVYEDRQYTNP